MFIDEKGNPSLQFLRKKLFKKHSNSRPSPGKHEVTLLHLTPSHLVSDYSSLVRKAFLNFVADNFELAPEENADIVEEAASSSSSPSLRPVFFIAAFHSRGKVCFDPYNFLGDLSVTEFLADRKLTCDVITTAATNGVATPAASNGGVSSATSPGADNSLFVFTLRSSVTAPIGSSTSK